MKTLRLIAAAALAAASLSAHAIGRLADITVYDRATRTYLPVYWHEGQAWIVGRPGNEYQVTMRNRSGEDLLAVVSVDGVNVMSGESASPGQSGYVVSGGDRVDVRGWRKSLDEIASFYFTSLGESYAARTGRPSDVGVIGVALFKRRSAPAVAPAWIDPPLPFGDSARDYERKRMESRANDAPPAEGAATAQAPALPGRTDSLTRAQPAAPSPLGTGHGRREESRVTWVDFERATRDPVEMVSIRYDSYRNLVARGVLAATREPSPFPGFVPDPPFRRPS
jgi:hypothetical protein